MTGKEFKNRIKELALLNELYERGAAKLIILYGRRRVGKSDLYKLNTDNPAIKQLLQLDWNLIQGSEKEIKISA